MTIDETIRRNLQRIIERENMTPHQFDKCVGNRSRYSAEVLSGRRSLGKRGMQRICRALGIEPWEFFIAQNTPIAATDDERIALQLVRDAVSLKKEQEVLERLHDLARQARRDCEIQENIIQTKRNPDF